MPRKATKETIRAALADPKLTEDDRKDLFIVWSARQSQRGEFPTYALTNLAANIRKQRERLTRLSPPEETK